jgi:(+)-pinoresinol hydroxylase
MKVSILALAIAAVCATATAADSPNEQSRKNSTADGQSVYEKWCAPCHAPGPFHAGTAGLEVKYKGSKPSALIERTDLTPEIVKFYVRNGFNAMPPLRKTEVTDLELEALANYLSQPKHSSNP